MAALRNALLASLVLAGAIGAWTPLPAPTRCHNDMGQVHGVPTLAACEAAAPPAAGAVTFCPPAGAAGCSASDPGGPQPGTCWFFAAASACEASPGWATATRPLPSPTPPPPPPADWAPRVAAGHMAFTAQSPAEIGEGFFPVVGNGFIGLEAGPFIQPFENAWPWRDAGALKMSGVYSGFNYTTPSHRAQIPRVSGVGIAPAPWATMQPVGAAIDFERGIFLNRTRILTAGGPGEAFCANGTIVEFALYAHRALRELFVMEVRAFPESGGGGGWECSVPLAWAISPSTAPWGADVALTAAQAPAALAVVWSGTTALPEEPGGPLRSIAVVLDSWAAAAPPALRLSSLPNQSAAMLRAVLRSDLDVAPGAAPGAVAEAALGTWQAYAKEDPAALRAAHEAEWAALWAGGGVELAGNATLAAAVNASLYDIVSSLRGDWPWSTSPGGLATGGYSGHSFWDMEVRAGKPPQSLRARATTSLYAPSLTPPRLARARAPFKRRRGCTPSWWCCSPTSRARPRSTAWTAWAHRSPTRAR